MKNNVKLLASTVLLSTFFVSYTMPTLAQYQPAYNSYSQGYNQGYNQGYQPPVYNNNYAQGNYSQKSLSPLQGRVMIPAGTALPATISTPITSEYARIGDLVTASLGNDMYSGGTLVLPAGSAIQGRIIDAQSSRYGNRSGRLNVRFDTAITPNGKRYNISGKLSTEDGSGIVYGGTTLNSMAKVAKNTAIGSAVGAVSGVALGGITGRPGRGTWAGTAIGAGTGFFSSFMTKGKEAIIPGNTKIDIILDQPVQEGY
jgi:hypothetical protein